MARPETHPVKKIIGFTAEMIDTVESWRSRQKPVPNLSEAIRRLVEIGLGADRPAPRPSKRTAARAAELAAKVIDKHIDPAAPVEERETRKRKVLHGPSAFRSVRKD